MPAIRLSYGGVAVGKVFAVDRTRGEAHVYLLIDGAQQFARIRVHRLTGSRLGGDGVRRGVRLTALTDDEIAAEVERRAGGMVFGQPVNVEAA